MDRETAKERLRQLQLPDADPEIAHEKADAILVQLLIALGYRDVTDEWEAVQPKLYA